jgi:acyl dehydratase
MKTISGLEDLKNSEAEILGTSAWHQVTQKDIDKFADVTGDHQWIHVDVERARTESPYGATIAHGFLTLSLIPALSKENYRVDNAKMGINYGLNRVRFLAPVPAGSRIRLRSELVNAAKVDDITVDLTVRQTVELDGSDKPAAVAEVIARMVF